MGDPEAMACVVNTTVVLVELQGLDSHEGQSDPCCQHFRLRSRILGLLGLMFRT